MKTTLLKLKKSGLFLALIALFPLTSLAQSPSDIVSQAGNQDSLLPRIYASEVTVKADGQNLVTGSFTMRNSETATVGNIQYEILLLDPLSSAPVGQLVSDNPNVYDRQRAKDIFSLSAGESRNIPFTYQAPAVPQSSYRIQIQIVTTNDRKLGWSDATVALGGANGFFVIATQNVNVDSTDPLTKEHATAWSPLEGINVDANAPISISAQISNPGSQPISGNVLVSVKRLLYQGINPSETKAGKVSLAPGTQQTLTVPIITQKTPSAYIVLLTIVDGSGKRISGVGEYRYVVRGQSASVASAQIKDIPTHIGELAQINFVIAGSADRVTPVSGTMEFTITDGQGVAGTIQKTFSTKGTTPVTGSAYVTLLHNICGTPKVTIIVKNTSGSQLDSFDVSVPNFTPKTCASSFLTDNIKTINLTLAVVAIVALYFIYRQKVQPYKKSKKKPR